MACSLSRFTKELLKKCNFRFFFSRCRPGRRDRELGGEEDPEQLQAVQVPKDALAGGRGPAGLGVFEVEVGEPAEVDAGPGRGELVQIESKDRKKTNGRKRVNSFPHFSLHLNISFSRGKRLT